MPVNLFEVTFQKQLPDAASVAKFELNIQFFFYPGAIKAVDIRTFVKNGEGKDFVESFVNVRGVPELFLNPLDRVLNARVPTPHVKHLPKAAFVDT